MPFLRQMVHIMKQKKKTGLHALIAFLKKETVFCIAALLAIGSSFAVPPDTSYASYLDYRVLALLFCLMLVVAGLQDIGLFSYLGVRLLGGIRTTRQLCLLLISLCFFSAMFITNDVALITFVPFAIMVLTMSGEERLFIPVIVLQTIAANLGSMLTPIGNPQNLYLYSAFSLPIETFLWYMAPLTLLSFVLLLLCAVLLKKRSLTVTKLPAAPMPQKASLCFYLLLFLLCLACVIHLLPWQVMLAVLICAILLKNRTLFKQVDYFLLLTFVCFFVFIGNIERLPAVSSLLRSFIEGRELTLGILFSQFISNVPAAILLSGFTDSVRPLLYGVNIGGLGTLIASLASVISFRCYTSSKGAHAGAYLKTFTIYNIIFLAVLGIAAVGFL